MKHSILRKSIIGLIVILAAALAASAQCGGSNKNCPAKSPPPLGTYTCNVTSWSVSQRRIVYDYKGYFILKTGNVYQWLDDGGKGKYSYNSKTFKINWRRADLYRG